MTAVRTFQRLPGTADLASIADGDTILCGGLERGSSGVADVFTDANTTVITIGGGASNTQTVIGKAGNITRVLGDFVVEGDTFSVDSENVLLADNHLMLNAGYTTVAAQTGGLTVVYLPTATGTTSDTGGFVNATNTINVVDTTGFAVGQFIQVSGAADPSNDGTYEIASIAGVTPGDLVIDPTPTFEFSSSVLVEDTTDTTAVITNINVSLIQSKTDGDWQVGKGATVVAMTTSLTDIATGGSGLTSVLTTGNDTGANTINISNAAAGITSTAGSSGTAGLEIDVTAGNGDGAGAGGALDFNAGVGGTTGDGGAITINAGAGGATSGTGGLLQLVGGNGSGASPGGVLSVTAGAGGSTGVGGAVTITAGDGGATAGAGVGGAVTITAGDGGISGASMGGDLSLSAGAGVGVNAQGGNTSLSGGAGTSTSPGGNVTINAGDTTSNGGGGIVIITGGDSPTGLGGSVSVSGGIGGFGSAGSASVNGGDATAGTNVTGGALTLTSGDGFGVGGGGGGLVSITAGVGGSNGAGGGVTITAGIGGSIVGAGGAASVTGGAGQAANSGGGAASLVGGAGSGSSAGGAVSVTGGAGGATGAGGAITVTAGVGGATGGTGGALSLNAGDATAGDSTGGATSITSGDGSGNQDSGVVTIASGTGGATGDSGTVSIDAGTAGGTPGVIEIGITNASSIAFGSGASTLISVYGATPVIQSAAYTRTATVVESRTLEASASATIVNNNNVLAALIADLQAFGVLG